MELQLKFWSRLSLTVPAPLPFPRFPHAYPVFLSLSFPPFPLPRATESPTLAPFVCLPRHADPHTLRLHLVVRIEVLPCIYVLAFPPLISCFVKQGSPKLKPFLFFPLFFFPFPSSCSPFHCGFFRFYCALPSFFPSHAALGEVVSLCKSVNSPGLWISGRSALLQPTMALFLFQLLSYWKNQQIARP